MAASACVERADLEASATRAGTESEIVFRELQARDVTELRELQPSLFPVRYSDSFYDRLFTDGHYTAVGCTVSDGEIVAVAAVRIVQRGDDAPPAQRNLREAYIMTLGVKESQRRRHLGNRVLRECLELVAARVPCDVATLHVKSDNLGALRFYERYGFVVDPDGFCKDHYLIEGVLYDAYRLTYSLPPLQSSSFLSFLPRCTVV